jgi:hypothetical protein
MTAPAATPSTAGHLPAVRLRQAGGLHRSFPPLPSTASLPADRRGRLRNGARPGDFLAAPRCGAHTRAGDCCRQPAMANGRCRLHGGLSTGPRTAEGRARCARARLKHGAYSAATRALMAEGRVQFRRVRALLGARVSAGHGVHRSNSVNHRDAKTQSNPVAPASSSSAPSRLRVESTARKTTLSAGHGLHRSNSVNRRDAEAQRHPANSSSASSRLCGESSVANRTVSSGHGLLRSLSQSRPSARAARLLTGAAPLAPFSAGHLPAVRLRQAGGLLRPFAVAGQF